MHGILVVFTFPFLLVCVLVLLAGLVDALDVAALERADGPTVQTPTGIRAGTTPSTKSGQGFLSVTALELALNALFEG